jgi:hypothetical protein
MCGDVTTGSIGELDSRTLALRRMLGLAEKLRTTTRANFGLHSFIQKLYKIKQNYISNSYSILLHPTPLYANRVRVIFR